MTCNYLPSPASARLLIFAAVEREDDDDDADGDRPCPNKTKTTCERVIKSPFNSLTLREEGCRREEGRVTQESAYFYELISLTSVFSRARRVLRRKKLSLSSVAVTESDPRNKNAAKKLDAASNIRGARRHGRLRKGIFGVAAVLNFPSTKSAPQLSRSWPDRRR